MPIWDDIVTDRDRLVYKEAGYGRSVGPGRRVAVMVIDVTVAFVGDRPEPILQSIKRFPNSCGEEGWKAVHKIRELLDVARAKKVPIIYTTGAKVTQFTSGRWAQKHSRVPEASNPQFSGPSAIPSEIAPQPRDIVITKLKPSAFFGTPLLSHMISMGIDTLMVTGCTTSGCVRATVTDAFSYDYRVLVVEECTFDRGETSHKINLFDMHQKYADVVSLSAAEGYLASLQSSLR